MIFIGYFMTLRLFPRYFHLRLKTVFPEGRRIEGNTGSRVKISGKYRFKPCHNLFIPCPQDVFRKFHYKIHHDNFLIHLKSARTVKCRQLQVKDVDGLPDTGENFQVREVLRELRETTS